MNNPHPLPLLLACLTASWIASAPRQISAQVNPYPGLPNSTPRSYSDIYAEQLRRDNRPQASAWNYTFNRYFYHRPTLSPYLSLTRPSGPQNLNNYQRWVVPELERRSQASTYHKPTMPSVPSPTSMTAMPAIGPRHEALQPLNPYFNQYYNFGGATPPSPVKPLSPDLPKLFP